MVQPAILDWALGGCLDDPAHATEVFERRDRDVREQLAFSRLLQLGVSERWASLCVFPGRAMPRGPCPASNTTAELGRGVSRNAMIEDARGLALTTASDTAAAHLDAAVAAYLRFDTETGVHLKRALAADPEFLMAHCLKGYFFKLFALPALEAKARATLAKARALPSARTASGRERLHLGALAAWVDGDLERAVGCLEAVLLDAPRDLVALKIASFLHFYLGDAVQIRDSIGRVMHAFDAEVPGYSYVLGMQAFGFEECGDYAAAERVGRRAIEIEPNDPWAVHAVAHVLEMQERRREGVAWLRTLERHWDGCNNFRYHLWWHLALFHLDRGEHVAVLDLYDTRIRAERSDEYLDICNAVSLLWRLEERGLDVGSRWDELAERVSSRREDRLLVFADLHFLLALAGSGRAEDASLMLDAMRGASRRGEHTHAAVMRECGLALAEAIDAWSRGDPERIVDALLPVRGRIARIGGSHAQRDLFEQLLIAAALSADRSDLARALTSERVQRQPSNAWGWTRYADALSACGEVSRAELARERAVSCVS